MTVLFVLVGLFNRLFIFARRTNKDQKRVREREPGERQKVGNEGNNKTTGREQ